MICVFKIFDMQGRREVTCEEVRGWKAKFRKENHTDEILALGSKDRAYEEYCDMVDNILKDCECKDWSNVKA
jgi:hypothetical protein